MEKNNFMEAFISPLCSFIIEVRCTETVICLHLEVVKNRSTVHLFISAPCVDCSLSRKGKSNKVRTVVVFSVALIIGSIIGIGPILATSRLIGFD